MTVSPSLMSASIIESPRTRRAKDSGARRRALGERGTCIESRTPEDSV